MKTVLGCLAFNTATHESTKYTSDKLLLGRELNSPLHASWYVTPKSTYVAGGDNQSFWSQAYTTLKQARSSTANKYNIVCKPNTYQAGDTVFYRMRMSSSTANNISAKFLLKWSKPVTTAKIVQPNMGLLVNPEMGGII
jgi:hypothetical protein